MDRGLYLHCMYLGAALAPATTTQLDALGAATDDHQQEVMLAAIRASAIIGPQAGRAAARNRVRDLMRSLRRALQRGGIGADGDQVLASSVEAPDAVLERKELLGRLSAKLSAYEARLLVDYSEAKSVQALWREYGCPVPERTFRQRIQVLREKCQQVLVAYEEGV